ncbi:MAG: COG1361 S-layer family protein [Methanotrichaceae archaeon]
MKLTVCLCLFIVLLISAQAETTYQSPEETANNYIPPNVLDNYWWTYGGPLFTADITGTNEFSRGDTVTLYIDLTNNGKIMGFKQDKVANTPTEYALANQEQKLEAARTTGLAIMGTLISDTSQIEIQSGDQVVQSLQSGQKATAPLKYTIKIGKHAPAGMYPLQLKLNYDYQYNVEVYANNIDPQTAQLSGYQTSYWYQHANQTIPIKVYVKNAADFEITKASGNLTAGEKKGPVEVTYKNIGEDPVNDGLARLSIFKPFSSTDDQAYIGDLAPGEEKTVVFRVDTDSDATPKDYGINSEIKYTDAKGDTIISESMKIPVQIKPASGSMLVPGIAALVLIVAAGIYLYRRRQKA